MAVKTLTLLKKQHRYQVSNCDDSSLMIRRNNQTIDKSTSRHYYLTRGGGTMSPKKTHNHRDRFFYSIIR